jgi:hypothetical protein
VRYAFGVLLLVVGNLAFFTGGRMALTGRNMTEWLELGSTKSDDLRLYRAPAAYFRAMGAMLLSIGGLVVWLAVVFLSITREPGRAFLAEVFPLAWLFVAALIASAIWFSVLAARHKLFRWNKP